MYWSADFRDESLRPQFESSTASMKSRTHKLGTARHPALASMPTAGGGIARAAYAAAVAAGLDVRQILQECGLTLSEIASEDVRIPVRSQILLLDAVANALPDPFLGAHLARRIDLRELGLLYYVLASSDNLGNALHRLSRYSSIQNEGVSIACIDRRQVKISFAYVGVARAHDCHQIEFFAAVLLRLCRELTKRSFAHLRVRFSHRRPILSRDIKLFYGCDVEFGCDVDEVVFRASVRNLVLVNADRYLNVLLIRYCDEIMAKMRGRSTSWRTIVENAIAPLLPHGEATIRKVASEVRVSRRTLARRLASEGVTFGELLKNLRVQLAKQYLREPHLRITEVAWLLGYRDVSAFSHAVRRWTGVSPARLRAAGEVSQ